MYWQQSIETQSQFLELVRQDSSELQLDYSAVRQQSTFSPGKSDTELEQFSSSVAISNGLPSPSILPEEGVESGVSSSSNSTSFRRSIGGIDTSYETHSSRTDFSMGPVVHSSRLDSLNIESSFGLGNSTIQSNVVTETTLWNQSSNTRQTLSAIPSPLVPVGNMEMSSSTSSFEYETQLPGFSSVQTIETFAAETEMSGMTQSLDEWSYELDLGTTELSVFQSRSQVSMPGPRVQSTGLDSQALSVESEFTSLSWNTPFGETTISVNEVSMNGDGGNVVNTLSTQSTFASLDIGTTSVSNVFNRQSFGLNAELGTSVNRIENSMSLSPTLQLEETPSIEIGSESRMSICEFESSRTQLSSIDMRMSVAPEVSFDITQQTNTVSLGLGVN